MFTPSYLEPDPNLFFLLSLSGQFQLRNLVILCVFFFSASVLEQTEKMEKKKGKKVWREGKR